MKVDEELFKIAKTGSIDEIIKEIKRKKDSINQQDHDGKTILHYIAARQNLDKEKNLKELFKELDYYKMNFNMRSNKGTVALHNAISYVCPNMVSMLIAFTDLTIIWGKNKSTFLHQAIDKQNRDIIKILLESDIKKIKAQKGSVMLFEKNLDNLTPVALARQLAKQQKNSKLLNEIINTLQNNFEIPQEGLIDLVRNNQYDQLEFYLAIGADPDKKDAKGDTLLHMAVGNTNHQYLELIRTYGPDVNAKNADNTTAVDRAVAMSRNDFAIKQLIEMKATIDYRNKFGNTILHTVSHNPYAGHLIIEFLYKGKKLDPKLFEATNSYGQTPLHFAAYHQNTSVIESLLKCGANIDIQDSKGRTPLHIAYANDKKDSIEALIRLGANTTIKDLSGSEPHECIGVQTKVTPKLQKRSREDVFMKEEKDISFKEENGENKKICLAKHVSSLFTKREELEPIAEFNNPSDLKLIIAQKEKEIEELSKTLALYQQEIIRLSTLSSIPIDEKLQLHFQVSEEDQYQI